MPKEPKQMMVPVGDAALMPLPPHNVCRTCGWVAADRTSLRMHERSHPHTMDPSKPHKCLYCEFRSRDRANMRVHERLHTNEKPYACDECDYTCKNAGNLRSHKRRHLPADSVACPDCTYTCRDLIALRAHARIHQPKLVDDDETGAPAAAGTAKKMLKCRFCRHVCSDRSNIRVHERTHAPAGARPFKCPECDYRSLQRVHLQLHVRRRHPHSVALTMSPGVVFVRDDTVPLPMPCVQAEPEPDIVDYDVIMRSEMALGSSHSLSVPMEHADGRSALATSV